MKALILSGGHGTNLRPLTYSQQKQLIPVANRPVLYYAIEDVINAGINEIGIVVGPNAHMVKSVVRRVSWNADIRFIYQDEPLGIAHAVMISQDFIGNSDFVVYLGDNILKNGIRHHTEKFIKVQSHAYILVNRARDPRCFGVVVLDKDGNIKYLVEKPKEPPSPFALVGVYFFKPVIFEAISHLKPSWRNELEITEAIQYLVDNNYRVEVSEIDGWWKDTGKVDDLLEANRLVLDDLDPSPGYIDKRGSTIEGSVVIGKNTQLVRGTKIIGPVVIGDDCRIENSVVGPYTSIGHNCTIISSKISDSIVMDDCYLNSIADMKHSIIGRGVRIDLHNKRCIKAVLGDLSRFESI